MMNTHATAARTSLRSQVVPPSEVWDMGRSNLRHSVHTLHAPHRQHVTHAPAEKRTRAPWWDITAWNSYVFGLFMSAVVLVAGTIFFSTENNMNEFTPTEQQIVQQQIRNNQAQYSANYAEQVNQ